MVFFFSCFLKFCFFIRSVLQCLIYEHELSDKKNNYYSTSRKELFTIKYTLFDTCCNSSSLTVSFSVVMIVLLKGQNFLPWIRICQVAESYATLLIIIIQLNTSKRNTNSSIRISVNQYVLRNVRECPFDFIFFCNVLHCIGGLEKNLFTCSTIFRCRRVMAGCNMLLIISISLLGMYCLGRFPYFLNSFIYW